MRRGGGSDLIGNRDGDHAALQRDRTPGGGREDEAARNLSPAANGQLELRIGQSLEMDAPHGAANEDVSIIFDLQCRTLWVP